MHTKKTRSRLSINAYTNQFAVSFSFSCSLKSHHKGFLKAPLDGRFLLEDVGSFSRSLSRSLSESPSESPSLEASLFKAFGSVAKLVTEMVAEITRPAGYIPQSKSGRDQHKYFGHSVRNFSESPQSHKSESL